MKIRFLTIAAIFMLAFFITPLVRGSVNLDETVNQQVAGIEAAREVQAVQEPQDAQAASACGASYTVRSGDAMYIIAQRCGVTLNALIAANPQITNPNRIYPGQVLNIPAGGIPVTGAYVVVRGDTLYRIAVRFNTTVAAILASNPQITNPNLIFPGQVIRIPEDGGIPVTGSYVVQPGDTLYRIAVRFDTTVSAIWAANPWIPNPNRIYPGWVIAIPESS